MTGQEIIDAAELCFKHGEFGDGTGHGKWEHTPVTHRAHHVDGACKDCPFFKKTNCVKRLASALLAGMKYYKEQTLKIEVIADKED